MRFLRMFTNSLLAGGLTAAYLTVLVLQLNPHVPIVSGTTWRWFVTLGLTYGLHLAIAFYLVIVAREFFSMDPMSPGWASVRVLAWLSASGAAVAAVLMWLNLNGFRAVLGDIAARRMTAGALATSASAVLLLAIALIHYSHGRRGSRAGGAAFVMTAVASLALPLGARGAAVALPDPRDWGVASAVAADDAAGPSVVMVLLDGASLEYIRSRSADTYLPNFSKLLQSGASMYLATVRPTQPGPVWAAAATGMYPAKNGVRSAADYYARGDARPIALLPDHCFSHALVQLGVVRAEPRTAAAWQARPLWSILSGAAVSAGIVRWPITYPAHAVRGFMVSDRFHDLAGSMAQFDARAAFPAQVLPQVRASFSGESGARPLAAAAGQPAETLVARQDRLYLRAARDLRTQRPVRVTAVRLQALDAAGHLFYDDSQPSAFRDGSEHDRRTRAQRLAKAYAAVDAGIGALLETLRPEDLLLVISGFGMQRLPPAKELLARAIGDPATRGSHERAPDGFLIAHGDAVQPGRRPRGSIVDVTPTLLYFLGLPVGRDMDGFARTDIFTTAFTSERPIAFIGSHNR